MASILNLITGYLLIGDVWNLAKISLAAGRPKPAKYSVGSVGMQAGILYSRASIMKVSLS